MPEADVPDSAQPPACGSGHVKGAYNTSLHVIALVIILVLSTLACSFPIIVRRFPALPVPHRFLFISRHFGTGVLIATAFVHLLPTAFISLTDPCLPAFWNKGYPAMAGLIAMLSVLMVVGIEMFFASRGAGHMHGSEYDVLQGAEEYARPRQMGHMAVRKHGTPYQHRKRQRKSAKAEAGRHHGHVLYSPSESLEHLVPHQSAQTDTNSAVHDGASMNSHYDEEEASDPDLVEGALMNGITVKDGVGHESFGHERRHYHRPRFPTELGPESAGPGSHTDTQMHTQLSNDQEQKKLLLQCILLEAGILFHSVFIGMALSVATGTSFIVLLVAISFHQTFEGIALGARIAAIPSLPPTSFKPWLMALAYGTTTPVGQAIGLLVHNMYDPASQTGLLMVGVMNAISSGLLLFAGLVELLAEDFLSDKSYEILQGRKRVEASAAVVAGGLLMAFVGAWA